MGVIMKRVIIVFICFFAFSMNVKASKLKVTLAGCIDGDTAKFNIKGEVKTVRFLSINAPEIAHDDKEAEPYGESASNYTCDVLKKAKSIKLQYDPKSDEVDKYGRVLAWVFVDDKLFQEMIVSDGLAEVKYVYDDYLYAADLQALEIDAQERKVGMWSDKDEVIEDNNDIYKFIISGIGAVLIFFVSIFCKNEKKKKKIIKKINEYTKN